MPQRWHRLWARAGRGGTHGRNSAAASSGFAERNPVMRFASILPSSQQFSYRFNVLSTLSKREHHV
jgi:hypothetical protein